MYSLWCWVSWKSLLIFFLLFFRSLPDCTTRDCLKCNESGCVKCPNFIMSETRLCVEQCPESHTSEWSTNSELMGRICTPNVINSSLHTVLVGIGCGAVLCFIIVFVGVMIVRRKHQKIQLKSIKNQLINDEYARHEFMRQLDELRPHAECFLHMLNDTRKQIRKSHVSGDAMAASKYHPIIRDLAKLLILINRPVELIEGPPHDWNRLYSWADKILTHYKPQQISHLIELLQNSPTHSANDVVDSRFTNKNTSTFCSLFYSTPVVKTRKMYSSTLPPNVTLTSVTAATKEFQRRSASSDTSDESKHDVVPTESLISLHDFEDTGRSSYNKKTSSVYGESFPQVKNYLSIGSLRIVDDEFIQLGCRPGDEITTEL